MHFKVYKKTVAKKTENWEKSSLLSFNIFKDLNKSILKTNDFRWNFYFDNNYFLKLKQNNYMTLHNLKKCNIIVSLNKMENNPFKLIPELRY